MNCDINNILSIDSQEEKGFSLGSNITLSNLSIRDIRRISHNLLREEERLRKIKGAVLFRYESQPILGNKIYYKAEHMFDDLLEPVQTYYIEFFSQKGDYTLSTFMTLPIRISQEFKNMLQRFWNYHFNVLDLDIRDEDKFRDLELTLERMEKAERKRTVVSDCIAKAILTEMINNN